MRGRSPWAQRVAPGSRADGVNRQRPTEAIPREQVAQSVTGAVEIMGGSLIDARLDAGVRPGFFRGFAAESAYCGGSSHEGRKGCGNRQTPDAPGWHHPHVDRLEPHRRKVIEAIEPIESEPVALSLAGGRVLSRAALARRAAPPFDCSAMDGYAVRHADVPAPTELALRQVLYAGDSPGSAIGAGEAARIFTGAPLPPGADAVVREESAELRGDRVFLRHEARPGENVRSAGEDVAEGGEALPAGVRIGPRQLALLEAVGCQTLETHRRPRIALLSTGDEVVRGRTPDSNGAALEGLLGELGVDVWRGAVADEPAEVRAALADAVSRADAVVTIGGVSVGEKDLVAG